MTKPNLQQFRTHQTLHEVEKERRQKISFLEQMIPLVISRIKAKDHEDPCYKTLNEKLANLALEYKQLTGHCYKCQVPKPIICDYPQWDGAVDD